MGVLEPVLAGLLSQLHTLNSVYRNPSFRVLPLLWAKKFSAGRDPIIRTPRFIVLFTCTSLPTLIRFHQGYTDDSILPLDGTTRRQGACRVGKHSRCKLPETCQLHNNSDQYRDGVSKGKLRVAEHIADPFTPKFPFPLFQGDVHSIF